MILLDTHIWVWWVHGDSRLSETANAVVQAHERDGLGVSIISCWEVAKLSELGRLSLPRPVSEWLRLALAYPGVQLIPLSTAIVVESTTLPAPFHRDPADQLIVATARVLTIPLLTADTRIRSYPHVQVLPQSAV